MDIDSSTNTTNLLVNEQERRSEIRKRNRTIVLIVFYIIIAVALITGGVFAYLIRVQYVDEQQSIAQDLAIQYFCSINGVNYLNRYRYSLYRFYSCGGLLSHHAYTTSPLMTNHPNKIFLFSLELSYSELSNVIATHPEVCLSSLTHALSSINSSLGVIRVNSDLETLSYEEMRGLKEGMGMALEDVGSCVNDTRKDGLKGEDEVNLKVYDVMVWMRHGNYFLQHCNRINTFFRMSLENDGERSRIVENFPQVSLFGSQYLVIVLLFWVFFRQ